MVAAAAGGATLLVLGLSWLWWLPALVRGRAEEAAAARLGMRAVVGGASLGLGSVELEDVRLEGHEGGLVVTITSVELDAGPFALAFGGPSAVERVDVAGVRVDIDLADDGAEGSFARIRAALGATGEPAQPADDAGGGAGLRAGREVAASGIDLAVTDDAGELLRVTGGEVELRAATIGAGAEELVAGGGESHRIALAGLAARLGRDEAGALQLASAVAAGAEVVWAERPADEATDPPPEDSPPTLFRRLRALVTVVRGGPGTELEAEGSDAPGWVRRLAEGATLELANGVVRQGDATVVRDLRAGVKHAGGGELHFEGNGAPASGGSLRWDLELSPLALRAEGTIAFQDLPLALVAPLLPAVPWHEPERGRLDGELTVSGDASEPLAFDGRLTLRDAALYSSRIAPEPIGGVSFTVEGAGTWDPDARRLDLERATLRIGRASATIAGALEWTPEHYLVDVTATLPSTDCGTAVGAIPVDLLAELSGFSWGGQIGGRVAAHVDSRDLPETRLDIRVADGCRFETVPALADLRRVQGPFLHRVLEPDGTWFEMTTGPGTGNWTSIHVVSPFLVQAVLAHEDASFFSHGGFAPWAIRDALERNLEQGRYAVGASTITMQLAKNLFLHREKTLARKVQEVLLTWWLESALEKRDILELYLNVIEYGPGVYGIRDAAEHYFGRDPSDLSPAEAAFLANVLPSPKVYHHQYERGELSTSMRNRMQRLLRHMNARGRIDDAALEHGLAEIEAFRFHRAGQPLPAARAIPGSAGPLPFASSGPVPWDDPWESWAEEDFQDQDAPAGETGLP